MPMISKRVLYLAGTTSPLKFRHRLKPWHPKVEQIGMPNNVIGPVACSVGGSHWRARYLNSLIDTSVWGWNMVQKWCSVSHTGNVMDKWLWKEWRIQDLPNFWRWGVCWNSFDSHNRVQHYFQKLYLSAGSHGVPSPTHVSKSQLVSLK